MELQDQTALVTGGGRGIGREITRHLVAQGARVTIAARDKTALQAVESEHGEAVKTIATDLSDALSVDALIDQVRTDHPNLSILINNAGIQTEMDYFLDDHKRGIDEARAEIAVNLDAAIALSVGLIPVLRRQDRAAIVNITSVLAITPKRTAPVYCATKAGLRSFSRSLRYQCRQSAPQISVNEVILPLVDTDMTRGRGRGKITSAQAADEIIRGIRAERPEIWVSKAKAVRIINSISPRIVARMLR